MACNAYSFSAAMSPANKHPKISRKPRTIQQSVNDGRRLTHDEPESDGKCPKLQADESITNDVARSGSNDPGDNETENDARLRDLTQHVVGVEEIRLVKGIHFHAHEADGEVTGHLKPESHFRQKDVA